MYRPVVLHVSSDALDGAAQPIHSLMRWLTATDNAANQRRLLPRRASLVHSIASPAMVEGRARARRLGIPFAVTVPPGWRAADSDQRAALESAALVIVSEREDAQGLAPPIVRRVELSAAAIERAPGARAADLEEHWVALARTGHPGTLRAPQEGTPTVAVVMVTYNRRDLLQEALAALAAQDYPMDKVEICVVDNGSTDDTQPVLEEWSEKLPLRVITYESHQPVVAARNAAIAATRSEIVAFTDDDCRPCPEWIRSLVQGFSDGVGIVQGKTQSDRRQVVTALSRTQSMPAEAGLYETCNVAYRRRVLPLAAGPFDETLARRIEGVLGPRIGRQPFGEDTELAWRVKSEGVATRFASDAIVEHHVFPPDLRYLLSRSWIAAAFPVLLKELPELRRDLLTGGFLLGARRARWWLAVVAAALSSLTPWTLVAVLPYLWLLLAPRKPRRLDRLLSVPVQLLRDLVESVALIYGSARAGCLVL